MNKKNWETNYIRLPRVNSREEGMKLLKEMLKAFETRG